MYLTEMPEGSKTDVTEIGGLEWDRVTELCDCHDARRWTSKGPVKGVCPVGIADSLARLEFKCVLFVCRDEAKDVCGVEQLCAGLEAGIEGGIHAARLLCKRAWKKRCDGDFCWWMQKTHSTKATELVRVGPSGTNGRPGPICIYLSSRLGGHLGPSQKRSCLVCLQQRSKVSHKATLW